MFTRNQSSGLKEAGLRSAPSSLRGSKSLRRQNEVVEEEAVDARPNIIQSVSRRWRKFSRGWKKASIPLGPYSNDAMRDSPESRAKHVGEFDAYFPASSLRQPSCLKLAPDQDGENVIVKDFDSRENGVRIPSGMTIRPGHVLVAIDGERVDGYTFRQTEDLLARKIKNRDNSSQVLMKFCDPTVARQSQFVVCRICEKPVEVLIVEEHSKYCMLSSQGEVEAAESDARLQRLIDAITARLYDKGHVPVGVQEARTLLEIRSIAQEAVSLSHSSSSALQRCSELSHKLNEVASSYFDSEKCFHENPRDQVGEDRERLMIIHRERISKLQQRVQKLIQSKARTLRGLHKSRLHLLSTELASQSLGIVKFLRPNSKGPVSQVPDSRPSIPPPRPPFEDRSLPRAASMGSYNDCEDVDLISASDRGTSVSIRDFDIVKPISKGAFGRVYLAKKKSTGDRFAIKVLAKDHVLRKKLVSKVHSEKNILVAARSPFVVKLFWTFQSRKHLFLAMEYLAGGDILSLLQNLGSLDEEVARLYIAETLLALQYLHSLGCVHRDLKPDNLLIGKDGHIKLTDFGLSEEGINFSPDVSQVGLADESPIGKQLRGASDELEAFNVSEMDDCTDQSPNFRPGKNGIIGGGTPDYLSPEIITGDPHGPEVDMWALGVILFEMLTGWPPFNDVSIPKIFDNILNLRIGWPEEAIVTPLASDLIESLLALDPHMRPTCEEAMAHPFFSSIDWDTLRQTPPPFVPDLDDEDDTSYFDNRNLEDLLMDEEMEGCTEMTGHDLAVSVIDDASLETLSPGMAGMTKTPRSTMFRKFSFTNMSALVDTTVADAKKLRESA